MPSVSLKSEATNQNPPRPNPLHNYYQTIRAHSHLGSQIDIMPKLGVFVHDRTFTQPIVWVTTLVIIAFHLGAVAALFMFSWKPFLLALFLGWLAGGFGIGMGYHRLLTHRGYKTSKWMEYLLTICATLTLEGGPIFWVATHRQHHQNTDKEGDPHSPNEGGL